MDLVAELTKIANSIRVIKGKTEKMKPSTFANEISKLAYINDNTTGKINIKQGETIYPSNTDTIIEGDQYLQGDIVIKGDSNLVANNIARGRGSGNYVLGVRGTADAVVDINYGKIPWSGKYANEYVQIARSYWDARIANQVQLAYSGGNSVFEGNLTNASGKCLLDCSTYIIHTLLKIPFNNSVFQGVTGNNKTIDPKSIKAIGSEFSCLLEQLVKYFSTGRIRYAADLAEFFWCAGRVIDEKDIRPGDLTFHAAKYDDGSYHINNRFKNISHVGIVAEEGFMQKNSAGEVTYYEYYNVTSHENVCIRTKSTTRSDIVFIARPDYTPRNNVSEVDSNINLLNTTYHSGGLGTNTLNGMKFKVSSNGNIETTGQPSDGTTFYLTSKSYVTYLKKGTYKLTGCPKRTDTTSGETWGLVVKNTNGDTLAWDNGDGVTFTISKDIESIYVYIYVSATKDSTGYTWKPKLARTA